MANFRFHAVCILVWKSTEVCVEIEGYLHALATTALNNVHKLFYISDQGKWSLREVCVATVHSCSHVLRVSFCSVLQFSKKDYECSLRWDIKRLVVHQPAVALEPGRIAIVLMNKPPSPSVSTLPIDDGVRVKVNGFWFLLNWNPIGWSKDVEPSTIVK